MHHISDTDTAIPVTFGRPDGQTAQVWVNGRAAGLMERYQDTDYWTYDHGGTSLVGTHVELRRQIQRHYRQLRNAVLAVA